PTANLRAAPDSAPFPYTTLFRSRESSRRREEETMTNPFVPILIMFGLAALLAVGGMAASAVIGPKRYNKVKVDAYECGIQPTRHAADIRFPIKYYLVAMTFIIFDIEVVFLYPWAVAFRELAEIGRAHV